MQVRTWDQSGCLPSKHGQGPARLPALRTRGPSSLHGSRPSGVLGSKLDLVLTLKLPTDGTARQGLAFGVDIDAVEAGRISAKAR